MLIFPELRGVSSENLTNTLSDIAYCDVVGTIDVWNRRSQVGLPGFHDSALVL